MFRKNVIKQNWRIKMSELKAKTLHMGPAQCAVDLGDGSERGEYVIRIIFYRNLADRIER